MVEPKDLTSWVIFSLDDQVQNMKDFVDVMKRTGREIGMQVNAPREM